MALRYAQPTADLTAAAEKALAVGLRNRSFHITPLRDIQPGQVRLSGGRPLGSVGVQDILNRIELSEVEIKVWQFVISTTSDPPESAGTLEMLIGDGAAPRMLSVSHGPFSKSAAAAIATLEASDDATDIFEVRLLVISALYVVALWLHHDVLPARFLLLEPAPPGLETGHMYSWHGLLDALGPLARERMASA